MRVFCNLDVSSFQRTLTFYAIVFSRELLIVGTRKLFKILLEHLSKLETEFSLHDIFISRILLSQVLIVRSNNEYQKPRYMANEMKRNSIRFTLKRFSLCAFISGGRKNKESRLSMFRRITRFSLKLGFVKP